MVKIVEWFLIVSAVSGVGLAIYISGWRDGCKWPNWTQLP
jgi:hypothetical protein